MLSRPEHQAAYSPGNSNFPSAENQETESSVGSVPRKKSSDIFPGLKRDGSRPCGHADLAAHEVGARRIDRVILPQQLVHDARPERRRRAYRERIAHRASIKISRPDGHGMFLVKAHGPRVTKAAACSGFCSYAFFECEGGIQAEAFPARFIVAQDVGDDIRRLRRYDTRDWVIFGGEKFRRHCQSATGKSGVSRSEIDQPDPGIAENESSSVVVEILWKIETPFPQFIKGRARADVG